MDETRQREPTRYREEQFDDEIELMDYLRVIWKWKYLIVAGTLVCAVAAGVISFSIPKVYRIRMLIRPGVLTISEAGIFGANDQIDKRIFPFPLWGYIALFGKNSGVNYFNCQEERFDPQTFPSHSASLNTCALLPEAGAG